MSRRIEPFDPAAFKLTRFTLFSQSKRFIHIRKLLSTNHIAPLIYLGFCIPMLVAEASLVNSFSLCNCSRDGNFIEEISSSINRCIIDILSSYAVRCCQSTFTGSGFAHSFIHILVFSSTTLWSFATFSWPFMSNSTQCIHVSFGKKCFTAPDIVLSSLFAFH